MPSSKTQRKKRNKIAHHESSVSVTGDIISPTTNLDEMISTFADEVRDVEEGNNLRVKEHNSLSHVCFRDVHLILSNIFFRKPWLY